MKVLITGTASGIGKGCAEFFLKENHEVYGFDKNLSTIQHPKYTHFCLDIRDKGSYPEIGPHIFVVLLLLFCSLTRPEIQEEGGVHVLTPTLP